MRTIASTLLIAVLVLLAPRAMSQVTFAPGNVLTAAGDTLRGELAELPELVASRQVELRRHATDEVLVLDADQVDKVVFDSGRTYVGRTLSPADELPPEALLLLRLVKGDVSLYAFSFEDPLTLIDYVRATTTGSLAYRPERFAVETPDGEVVALYERRIQMSDFQMQDVRIERQFEHRLREVFADCESVVNHLRGMRFRQSNLVNIVTRYNECIGGDTEVLVPEATRRRADVAVDFGVRLSAGGGAFHRLRLRNPSRSNGAVFSAGVLARVRPILIHRNLSIPIEVRIGHSGLAAEETVSPLEVADFATLRGGLTLGLEQTFPVGGLEPFVGMGITTSRIFQERVEQCTTLVCWYAPQWEAGHYFDVGIAGRPLDPLGRLSFGVRFESIGLGHQNPFAFARADNTWQARTISAFTVVQF